MRKMKGLVLAGLIVLPGFVLADETSALATTIFPVATSSSGQSGEKKMEMKKKVHKKKMAKKVEASSTAGSDVKKP
jgi:hypothetical protein